MKTQRMADEDYDMHDHNNDPNHHSKRQRVSQACDWCRKKKIRCDGEKPTCTNCKNYKTECIYTQMPRKPRVVKKPKKSTSIGELENRLDRIETLLEAIVPGDNKRRRIESDNNSDSEDEDSSTINYRDHHPQQDVHPDYGDSESWSQDDHIPVSSHFISVGPQPYEKSDDTFTISVSRGTQHFTTNGNIFSLFTPAGLKWISDKTGDKEIPSKLLSVLNDIHFSQQMRKRPFIESDQPPDLPDEQLMRYVVRSLKSLPDSLQYIIRMDEMESIIDAMMGNSEQKNGYAELLVLYSAMTALVPMMLMFGSIRQKLSLSEKQVWDLYNKYSSGAMYYYHKVAMIKSSMTAVQGLVLLMMGLQLTHAHPIAAIAPVAVRFAHELGLHRWESSHGLSADESQRRRTLWWLVYCVDRDAAMKVGRAPTIMDFDVSTKYPDLTPDTKEFGFDFLTLLSKLLKISGDMYEKLFSAQASRKPPAEIVKDVAHLDSALSKWRDELPPKFRPGTDETEPLESPMETQAQQEGEGEEFPGKAWHRQCSVLHLHYCYYQILGSVHRITAYHPSWIYSTVGESSSSSNASPAAAQNSEDSPATVHPSPTTNISGNSNGSTSATAAHVPSGSSGSSSSGAAANTAATAANHQSNNNKSKTNVSSKFARLFASLDICVQSARSTIELVRISQDWDQQFLWGAIYYCANSFLTLFIKCIAKPRDTSTQYDLDLMKSVLEIFRGLEVHHTKVAAEDVLSFSEVWGLLCDTATAYVQKRNSTNSPIARSHSQQSQKSQQYSPISSNNHLNNNNPGVVGDGNSIPSTFGDAPMNVDPATGLPLVQQALTNESINRFNNQHQHNFQQQASQNQAVDLPPLYGVSDDVLNQGDASSIAQSMHQFSSYFYSMDPDFSVFPDFNLV